MNDGAPLEQYFWDEVGQHSAPSRALAIAIACDLHESPHVTHGVSKQLSYWYGILTFERPLGTILLGSCLQVAWTCCKALGARLCHHRFPDALALKMDHLRVSCESGVFKQTLLQHTSDKFCIPLRSSTTLSSMHSPLEPVRNK